MGVLSPFISILCHSDWLFDRESCPRLDVVYPGRAWSSSPAYTWHCSLHYFFSPGNSLVSSWYDHSMLTSLLWQRLAVPSLLHAALLRTHLLVFFAVHETRRIFRSLFISEASRRVSFFLNVQLSQPYVAIQVTIALSFVSSLKSVCYDFSIFSVVMPDRLPSV